jgi:hypothetical protein
MAKHIRKIIAIIPMLLIAFNAFAPSRKEIVVLENPPVEPFKKLIDAIGMVETKRDTLAYNPFEVAVGYFQIRPVRLKDYNERTGSSYLIQDMFNYRISEKIFLYYASKIGPYNFERIAREWNGSGKMTYVYWKEVKKNL